MTHPPVMPDHDRTLFEMQAKPLNPLNACSVRVTPRFLYFEKGSLRSSAQQIPMAFVFDVDATQSMVQKTRGVGSVTIKVVRGEHTEVVRLDDLPEHRHLVAVLNDVSHQARLRETQLQHTQHVQWAGQSPYGQQPPQQAPVVPPAPQNPGADEIIGQIKQLGELRDAGVLSEDEFQAKKTDLLGRL